MDKILIIKLGALGDVVRTTPILRALDGEVFWITSRPALPLLKGNPLVERSWDMDQLPKKAEGENYDLVLCLDEEERAADLASTLNKKELIGTYMKNGRVAYTDSSKEWFDMSLISRLGKRRADELKWQNRKSYQEILFGMLGKKFNGEEYVLPETFSASSNGPRDKITIGIESRAGERWIGKRWPHQDAFIELVHKKHYPEIECRKFGEYKTLEEFARAIGETDYMITTDTLALHLALGLKKPTLAIFTVTSPHEIHGYGRMLKVASPLLKEHFYSTAPSVDSGLAVKPAAVYGSFLSLSGLSSKKQARLA